MNESSVMSRRGKQVNWPHDQHQFAGTRNFYTDINKEGRMQLHGAQYSGRVSVLTVIQYNCVHAIFIHLQFSKWLIL